MKRTKEQGTCQWLNFHSFSFGFTDINHLGKLGRQNVLTAQLPFFSPLLIMGGFGWGFFTASCFQTVYWKTGWSWPGQHCRPAAQAEAADRIFPLFPAVYFDALPLPRKQEKKGMVSTASWVCSCVTHQSSFWKVFFIPSKEKSLYDITLQLQEDQC